MRPPTFRIHAWLLASLVAGAACTPPRPPEPATPAPTPPAAAAPPSAPPVTEAPRSWSFAYTPGRYAYRVVTNATIEPRSDSVARAESLTTTALVSYAIVRDATGGGALSVEGTVDSFTVQPYGGRPAPPSPSLPFHFRATIGADGRVTTFRADSAAAVGCSPAAAAALALARETVIGVPAQLAPGQAWDDTTTSNECPGGAPLTIATRRHYEVQNLEPRGQGTALRVTRTSDVTVSGAGTQRGLPLTIAGGGNGRTELFLDAQAGRLLGSTSDYTVSVTIAAAGSAHEMAQRVKQTVELLGSPGP